MFGHLSSSDQTLVCRAVADLQVAKGERVCSQGDEMIHVYALCDGQLKSTTDGDESKKLILKAPHSFGEAAMYPDQEQRVVGADITAWAGSAMLMRFAVADVEALLGYGLQARAMTAFNRRMLEAVTIGGKLICEHLAESELAWLCAVLVHEPPRHSGERVIAEGETDEKLFIIRRGVASVSTARYGEAGTLSAGQFFGELALTGKKHKRTASISVKPSSGMLNKKTAPDLVRLAHGYLALGAPTATMPS